MMAYTLMLSVTSTIAYATIFNVLFDADRTVSVIIGGGIVLLYSSIGGMWSITLTDMVQFVLKTIGVFFLLLPFAWIHAGGYEGIVERAGDSVFDLGAIGVATIITFFVVYTLGMLIGQDIWQRVFTARSPKVASGVDDRGRIYCLLYGVAGALIGTAASSFLPTSSRRTTSTRHRRADLAGRHQRHRAGRGRRRHDVHCLGALIATATVAKTDVTPLLARVFGRGMENTDENAERDVHSDRLYVVALGIAVIVIAALLNDVVNALTIAYDILVGGLLVPILGGFLWKRATGVGALCSMAAGTVVTLGTMVVFGVAANEPIYYGLAASLIAYVVGSLLTPRTPANVLQVWDDRLAGGDAAEVEAVDKASRA